MLLDVSAITSGSLEYYNIVLHDARPYSNHDFN